MKLPNGNGYGDGMLFVFGAVMVAQTPKHVFLGQKIPVRTMPNPVPVKLGRAR